MERLACILLAVLAVLRPGAEQQPSFEVASLKPNQDPRSVRMTFLPGGQFSVDGFSLSMLLERAYGLKAFRFQGLPRWAADERYDIRAKAEDPQANNEQLLAMLKTLLVERFQLKLHEEPRVRSVFLLMPDRDNRELGRNVHPSTTNCGTSGAGTTVSMGCGVSVRSDGSPVRTFTFHGRTLSKLASDLETVLGEPVLDRTELGGQFDFEISFTPRTASDVLADGSLSVFTAVREQLGLRLQSSRAPVGILVIDSVQHPTSD